MYLSKSGLQNRRTDTLLNSYFGSLTKLGNNSPCLKIEMTFSIHQVQSSKKQHSLVVENAFRNKKVAYGLNEALLIDRIVPQTIF